MHINWNGFGSFTITSKPADGEVTLVTDPFDNSTGLRFPRTQKASMVIVSHEGEYAGNTAALLPEGEKSVFVVDHPGEYEVKGMAVQSILAKRKDSTRHNIFKIIIEDIKIGFLGALDRELTEKEVEALGDIDVLILPIGGKSVMDSKIASSIVGQIEPRLVIPSYGYADGSKVAFAGVEAFCKDIGFQIQEAGRAKITKSSLPDEDTQIIILSR
jgi:L-ascorbate metabolism protein UlaG (beta-lactamase superfamily)